MSADQQHEPPVATGPAPDATATVAETAVPTRAAAAAAETATPAASAALTALLRAAVAEARGDDEQRTILLLERELEAEKDRGRRALLAHELGELLESRRHDDGAAARLYVRALAEQPALQPNLQALRRVLSRHGLWPNLLKLLEVELRCASDDRTRAEVLLERGHILEDRLSDGAAAREAYQAAAKLADGETGPLLALQALCLREHDLPGRLATLAALARPTSDPARRAALLVEAARLEEARGQVDEAAILLAQELHPPPDESPGRPPDQPQDRPQDQPAAEPPLPDDSAEILATELERLGEQHERATDLLQALDIRVAILDRRRSAADCPPADRLFWTRTVAALCRRQSQILRNQPAGGEPAFAALRRAFELCPSDRLLLYELCELAEELGREDELAVMLLALASQAGPEERAALLFERAQALTRAGQTAEAAAALEELGRTDPGWLPLLCAEERRALRASDPRLLARTYEREADALRVAPVRDGASRPPPSASAGLYTAAAEILADRLGDHEQALALAGRALEVLPDYLPAVRTFEALALGLGRWQQLAELYHAEAALDDAWRSRYALEALTSLLRDRLADLEGAIDAAGKLARRYPEDLRAQLRLCELLAAAESWPQLCDQLLETARRFEQPGDEVASLRLFAAEVAADELGQPERAIAIALAVLAADPAEEEALERLAGWLRGAGRLVELPDILATAAAAAPASRKARLWQRGAEVLLRELAQPASAVESFAQALRWAPDDPALLAGLLAAGEAAGDISMQVQARRAQAETATDEQAVAIAWLELGDLLRRQPEGAAEAAAAYRHAIASPEAEVATEAALGLIETSARQGDVAGLIAAYSSLAEQLPTGADQATCAAEAGRLLSTLGRADQARAQLDRVLSVWPDDAGARLGLTALAAAQTRSTTTPAATDATPASRAAAWHELATHAASTPAATSLWLVASLIARAAGQTSARDLARRAAAAAPPHSLATLLVAEPATPAPASSPAPAVGRQSELPPAAPSLPTVEELRRRAALLERPDTGLVLELAAVLAGQGRLAEAAAELDQVLAHHADGLRATAALSRLAHAAQDEEAMALTAARTATLIRHPQRAAAGLTAAARIYEQRLHRLDDAASLYRQALSRDPRQREAFDGLCAILRGRDEHADLEQVISQRLEVSVEPAERLQLHVERGRLRMELLADPAGAEVDWRAVQAACPDDPEALEHLATLQAHRGDLDNAATMLARIGDMPDLPLPRRRLALSRLADLCFDGLGDTARGLACLRRILDELGGDDQIFERLLAVLLEAGQPAEAVQALRRRAGDCANPQLRGRLLLRAASLLRDQLGDPAAAQQAFAEAWAADEELSEALFSLADLYRQTANQDARRELLDEGIERQRRMLDADPCSPTALRSLERLFALKGRPEARETVCAALGLLGVASPEQRALCNQQAHTHQQVLFDPTGAHVCLSEEDLRELLLLPETKGAASEVWAVLGPIWEQANRLTPAQLGASRHDQLASSRQAQTAPAVHRCASLLGIADLELYRLPGWTARVALAGPALLVASDLLSATDPAARFLLGRALLLLRFGWSACERMSAQQARRAFAAARRMVGAGGGVGGSGSGGADGGDAELRLLERSLARAASRKQRKALSGLALRLFETAGVETRWLEAVCRSADRAGLLLAGDLAASVEAVQPSLTAPRRALLGSQDVAAALQATVEVSALWQYALSEEYLLLRQRVGL